MKIIIIYSGPILTSETTEKELKIVQDYQMPLGVLYLGQILKDNGHNVILFDHNITGMSINSVVNWIKKVNPDILGFSVLSSSLFTSNAIAKKAKERNPNLIIVYGSYIPTFCAHEVLKHCNYVDFCVRNEGELTIIELLNTLERNQSVSEVLGITYRCNGEIIENPDRPLIQDLDTIPFPNRKLFRHSYQFSGKVTTIISSRGCPYRCRFCNCWKFAKGKWRLRSVENVVEEMLYLQNEGFQEILFTDDCFNANQNRILKLCKLMKQEKIELDWHAVGRIDKCDTPFLRTMVKSGCKTLVYGIESANQRILDYYAKKITPAMAIDAIKNSKKAGIEFIFGGFIIGAPTETLEEVLNTIRFGLKLQEYGLSLLQFQLLYLSPGTDLYQEFLEKGLIDQEKYWGREIPAVDIFPNSLNKNYLEILAKKTFKQFITTKSFLISEYLKSAKSLYRLRAMRHIFQPKRIYLPFDEEKT